MFSRFKILFVLLLSSYFFIDLGVTTEDDEEEEKISATNIPTIVAILNVGQDHTVEGTNITIESDVQFVLYRNGSQEKS